MLQPLAQWNKWSLYQVTDITETAYLESLHKEASKINEEIKASEKDCSFVLALIKPHADNESLKYLNGLSELINVDL